LNKQSTLLFSAAALCLASLSAWGAEPTQFSLLGIELGQDKSALDPIGHFDCHASDNPSSNELCSAQLTIDKSQVRVLASLKDGLIVGIDAFHTLADRALFDGAVETAINRYGAPQERVKSARGEFVGWRLGDQQYSISTSGTEVTFGLMDMSIPAPPPALPTHAEHPATP
jgi:hypothetical protein